MNVLGGETEILGFRTVWLGEGPEGRLIEGELDDRLMDGPLPPEDRKLGTAGVDGRLPLEERKLGPAAIDGRLLLGARKLERAGATERLPPDN